jgi:hypothetical protein
MTSLNREGNMNLKDLKTPFPEKDILYRIGRSGIKKDGGVWALVLSYIDARHVYDRLDEVCGQSGWQITHRDHTVSVDGKEMVHGIISSIGINIAYPDGFQWVWKEGGADSTDYESFKGCISDADKRAAVLWGVGRHLYERKEMFVKTSLTKIEGWNFAKCKGKPYWWETPKGGQSQISIEEDVEETEKPEDHDDPHEFPYKTPIPKFQQPTKPKTPPQPTESTQDGRSLDELKEELENKLLTVLGSGVELDKQLPFITAGPINNLNSIRFWDLLRVVRYFNQNYRPGPDDPKLRIEKEWGDMTNRGAVSKELNKVLSPEDIPEFIKKATSGNGLKKIGDIVNMKQFGLMKRRVDAWIETQGG